MAPFQFSGRLAPSTIYKRPSDQMCHLLFLATGVEPSTLKSVYCCFSRLGVCGSVTPHTSARSSSAEAPHACFSRNSPHVTNYPVVPIACFAQMQLPKSSCDNRISPVYPYPRVSYLQIKMRRMAHLSNLARVRMYPEIRARYGASGEGASSGKRIRKALKREAAITSYSAPELRGQRGNAVDKLFDAFTVVVGTCFGVSQSSFFQSSPRRTRQLLLSTFAHSIRLGDHVNGQQMYNVRM